MIISLDPIRDDLIAWAESLFLPDTGAFRNGDAPAPSLPEHPLHHLYPVQHKRPRRSRA